MVIHDCVVEDAPLPKDLLGLAECAHVCLLGKGDGHMHRSVHACAHTVERRLVLV